MSSNELQIMCLLSEENKRPCYHLNNISRAEEGPISEDHWLRLQRTRV